MPTSPTQQISFHELGPEPLEKLCKLTPPATREPEGVFKQLRKIEQYVRDPELGCKSVAVEGHYIDRDFMEDFSVFYGRSLQGYRNYCQRVHFFTQSVDDTRSSLRSLAVEAKGQSTKEYRAACEAFSLRHYRGFCVIKPLSGTPVGRTVLSPFPVKPQDGAASTNGAERVFGPTRRYRTHFMGVELTVHGLGFQQQDVGVAACATTAIWTSLQKIRDHEEIGVTTPAQITIRATNERMPFGRSMPSEGLSIDQMCQAVQAFGVSPVLTRVSGFDSARAELFSACQSQAAPVLIIADEHGTGRHHAIAAAGMKLATLQTEGAELAIPESARLEALYVHDDRFGPYLLATLIKTDTGGLSLRIRTDKGIRGVDRITRSDELDKTETWKVSHILVPTHSKVRLSIPEIQLIATHLVSKLVGPTFHTLQPSEAPAPRLVFDAYVTRSHLYLESLIIGAGHGNGELAIQVASNIALSRYLAVIRIKIVGDGTVDVLIDTTSTNRNPSYLGVLCGVDAGVALRRLAGGLATVLNCEVFFGNTST